MEGWVAVEGDYESVIKDTCGSDCKKISPTPRFVLADMKSSNKFLAKMMFPECKNYLQKYKRIKLLLSMHIYLKGSCDAEIALTRSRMVSKLSSNEQKILSEYCRWIDRNSHHKQMLEIIHEEQTQ